MPLEANQQYIDGFNESMNRSQQAQNAVGQNPNNFAQNFSQRQPEWRWGKWDPDTNNAVTQAISEREQSLESKLWGYTMNLDKLWIQVQGNNITLPNWRSFDITNNVAIQGGKWLDGPFPLTISSDGRNLIINQDGSVNLDGRNLSESRIKEQNKLAQSILWPNVSIQSFDDGKLGGIQWKIQPIGMHNTGFYFSDGSQVTFTPKNGQNISMDELRDKLLMLKDKLSAPSSDPNKVYWWDPRNPIRPKN